MREGDIDAAFRLADLCFPDHFEPRACFAERLALFPQGCFVLTGGAALKGYLVAYPWPAGTIPPLGGLLGRLPPQREAFWLHDLALHPEARGKGLARPALALLDEALGGGTLALVSVNASTAFWQGLGFRAVAADEALAAKLSSYGEGARYMVREV